MKETDGYLVEDDDEEIIIQEGCSPISEPEVHPVHHQEPKVAIQPQRQVQEADKVTKIESICPDIKNEAVTGCNQDQYRQVNNYNASSDHSNYSKMPVAPGSAINYGAAIQTHNQHIQSAPTHHTPVPIQPAIQHHPNQQYQQPTVHYPTVHLPASHQQSHPPVPTHQSPPTQSRTYSTSTYGEDTYCNLEPIDSPKSNCSSGIGSLSSPTTCYQTIYDHTQDASTHAKSVHRTNHAQLDINITDLNPQSLLNCSSAEFEATMNHLFYL